MRPALAFLVAVGFASGAVIQVDFHRHHSSAAAQRRAGQLNKFFGVTQHDGANGTYPQQVNDFRDIVYVGNISIGMHRDLPKKACNCRQSAAKLHGRLRHRLRGLFRAYGQCGYFQNCGYYCHNGDPQEICEGVSQCPAELCSGKPYALPPGKCDGKRVFDSTKSSTYKKDEQAWYIDYGSGSASGFTGFETVRLGDAQNLLVKDYNFGLATCLDPSFSPEHESPNDGMFGLSPGATDTAGEKKTVLEVAYEQGHLDQPVFTAWLEEKGDATNVRAGVYTFGGLDTEHCGPVIDYRAVTKYDQIKAYQWWKFDVEGVSLGDYKATGNLQAVSDSGTTLVLATMPYVKQLAEKAGVVYDKDAEVYPIACDATFDPLVFTIGGKQYSVDHKQLIIDDPDNPHKCFLGIAELKVDEGEKAPFDFLLGDPWVRQYCQVHDFKQKRIGFAVAKP